MTVTVKLLKNGAKVQVLDATDWKIYPRRNDIIQYQGIDYWVSGGWMEGETGNYTIIAQELVK